MKSVKMEELSQKHSFGLPQLTKRELEVLARLSMGDEYNEIATWLQISINGVRAHIKNIYRKLQVNNSVQAARIYWQFELETTILNSKMRVVVRNKQWYR